MIGAISLASSFIPWRLVAGVAAAAALAGAGAWFVHHQRELGRQEVRAEWAADREKATLEAQQETDRRTEAQKEIAHVAALDRTRVARNLDAARAVGLRGPATAYAASVLACNPAVDAGGPPAPAPAVVLAELLGGADDMAEDLAAAYDNARISGLACERSYDALGR